jgi:hypothetical protein
MGHLFSGAFYNILKCKKSAITLVHSFNYFTVALVFK